MNTKIIKLDLNRILYDKIIAKQGDTKSRFLLFQLLDGSIAFNLTNRSVRAYMVKPDGKEIFNDLIINNYSLGYCTLELTNQVLAVQGTVKIELMVTEEDRKLTSSVFELEVIKSINSEKSIVSTNEFTALLNGLSSLSEYDNYKNEIAAARDGEVNLLTKVKKIDEQLDTITQQKLDKNAILSMSNMGQDVKEAMTGGSVAVVGKDTILTENIVDKQVTPNKTSFYYRESNNLYDISTLNKNYCNNVETIEEGVLVTKSLGANVAFYLNVNSLDNAGKGVQTLKAGTYYLKYKAKGTSGETGSGSGIYPPRLYGSDAIRHNFTKVSGVNSTDFTEWVWSITLESDVLNYGFLMQNGSFAEVYTIKDIMITSDVNNEYEDYETYYYEKNIKNKKYDNYENSILENKKAIKNIEDKMLTIENPKVLHCGFIGDSLTEGDYGSLDGSINKKDLNYPYFFKQATGWTGTNFGKCGWTTKDVWERIVSTMHLSNTYKIFIIMLGTNGGLTDTIEVDCIGDDYNNYANTQTASYCKIVEHIMKNCPTAQIFLCTPPYNNKTGKKEYIIETGNVVKKIAKKYNIQVIDVYSELGVNSLNENVFLPIDRLHFGQYGYQKLGVFLANKIKSNLSYYDL